MMIKNKYDLNWFSYFRCSNSDEEAIELMARSGDFWTIPYLIGKGLSLDRFRALMTHTHQLLTLEIASVPEQEKHSLQQKLVRNLVQAAKSG